MKRTLIDFPHELAGLPLFGFGWLLIGWLAWSLGWALFTYRRRGSLRSLTQHIPIMLIVGVVIVIVMPWLEPRDAEGQPTGMAVRGYGFMMMLGVVSGIGMAVQRGRRMGIHPDVIFSLALIIFMAGMVGARLFYVIQYWKESFHPPGEPFQLLVVAGRVLKFTEGGLVVYGALIFALGATLAFLHRRGLPKLAIADLLGPAMMIGLALGRIGCFLNGCCYGGVCPPGESLGLEFPASSPPYAAQLYEGTLLGLQLDGRRVEKVREGSLAEHSGITEGDVLDSQISVDRNRIELTLQGAESNQPTRLISWDQAELPERAVAVYPSQLLGSINALLLCFLLYAIYPYRKRDGQVIALMLVLYATTRFFMEIIRSDELHSLFSLFTPAQTVSLLIFTIGTVLLIATSLSSRPLALPVKQSRMNPGGERS
jgi:phosphatidylglycerol:prolipoprotein diacylglycerol transferase